MRRLTSGVRSGDDENADAREVLEPSRSFGWFCEHAGCETADTRTVHDRSRRAPEPVRLCRYHIVKLVSAGATLYRPDRQVPLTEARIVEWWPPDNEVRDTEDGRVRKGRKVKPKRAPKPEPVEVVDDGTVESRVLRYIASSRAPVSGFAASEAAGDPYPSVLSALVRLERLGKIREAGVGRWVFVAVRR